ncbi:hypothetical protein EYF80_059345 [Liparis tanakae]|uniref:Uncharacterized protein n=1 Tax=Liparis tanakae TaxID=230148 RepID=A0A4Z2ENY2_9TELE|nr:hypothetical protein EYF80_059345 [Liparis tanakae]
MSWPRRCPRGENNRFLEFCCENLRQRRQVNGNLLQRSQPQRNPLTFYLWNLQNRNQNKRKQP